LEPLVRLAREKLAWSSADKVLSVSEFVSNDLARYYGINGDSIRTVFNGVDEKTFRLIDNPTPPCPGLEGKKLVLYVGHFGQRKGVIHLIRAMKRVKEEVRDSHLLCIGGVPRWLAKSDYVSLLRHEVESSGLSENVTLMDAIPHERLASAYSSAKVFAFPSYNDAAPKVVLEAMSCSKAVVATNGGGIPEMVQEGRTGLLVNYSAPNDLASALIRLLEDEKEASRMGQAGRERVEEMFTWTKVVERIGRVYLEA
jgi:starch synthase